jgi:hypothetical protein
MVWRGRQVQGCYGSLDTRSRFRSSVELAAPAKGLLVGFHRAPWSLARAKEKRRPMAALSEGGRAELREALSRFRLGGPRENHRMRPFDDLLCGGEHDRFCMTRWRMTPDDFARWIVTID